MKTKTTTCALFLAALVAAPGAARADATSDAVDGLSTYMGSIGIATWNASWLADKNSDPAGCPKVIAKAKKAGVKDTDVLTGGFQKHPKARQSKRGDSFFEIDFADAAWICEEYARVYAIQGAMVPLGEAADFLKGKSAPTADDARGYNTGAGEATAERGRQCLKAVDGVIAGGTAGTTKVKVAGKQITLADAKTAYCQALIDYGTAFEGFITEAQALIKKEKAAKYEAVGISGQKLELFIEYDSVYWRGKKCAIIDDVAVLAKATKLYQWLENADGTHTIRTYVFKGNTVKSKKDKTYKTEKKAYKGCK